MANQYDTNLKLQAIADAIGDSGSSGLISALEDIADAVAGGGGGGSSTAGLVSDNFSETDTYDLGDYCIHNNTLYVCINAITTPGPWDLSDWQATNAGLELSSLNSALSSIGTFKEIKTLTNGNPVVLDNVIDDYTFIYVLLVYGNDSYYLQPSMLPTYTIASGIPYVVNYYDGTQLYSCMFNIGSDRKTITPTITLASKAYFVTI